MGMLSETAVWPVIFIAFSLVPSMPVTGMPLSDLLLTEQAVAR